MISDIITKENIVLVKDAIESNNKFIITAHISPDGDAMGSSLGLYHFIKDKGKEVTIIFNDQFPAHLGWLDGSDKILIFEEEKIKSEKLISEADVIFCCDFNASYRMGDRKSVV